jgi:hypothetical protein
MVMRRPSLRTPAVSRSSASPLQRARGDQRVEAGLPREAEIPVQRHGRRRDLVGIVPERRRHLADHLVAA